MKKILTGLLVVLLLAGCSSPKTSETAAPKETVDPKWAWLLEEPTGPEATEVVLELTSESLTQSLEYYFLSQKDEATYMQELSKARSFTVDAFSQEGDIVTAEVTVEAPDLYTILSGMDMEAYATVQEMDTAICSAMETAQLLKKQVTLQFTAGNNCWEPVLDADAADAFYGGLITYLQEQTAKEAEL